MMERSSIFTKAGSNTQQSNLSNEVSAIAWKKRDAAPFLPTQTGFNLTQVPARPKLQTIPRMQCCAKDGTPCACPACSKASESNLIDEDAQQSRHEHLTVEQASSPTQEAQTETEPAGEQAVGFIVDDSTANLSGRQMKKSEFLQQLRAEICRSIGPVLATVGQTTEGCPYLNYWLNLYQQKDAAHLEHTVRKYAPDAINAKAAAEYISIVSGRALRAAEIWAATGKLSGVPEGVPVNLPGQTADKNAGPVMAKAKEGGVRHAKDPRSIQEKLGSGHQLEGGVRSRMESAFGMDFSHIRAHTDSVASGLSSHVNARAFTVGNHVAFGSGEYKPGTILGDALIAHELAHTIQQGNGELSMDKMQTGDGGYERLEQDADQAATSVVSSLWSSGQGTRPFARRIVSGLRSGLQIQRCSDNNASATKAKAMKNVTVDFVKLKGSTRTPATDLATANNVFKGCSVSFSAGQNVTASDADSVSWLNGDTDLQVSSSCGSVSTDEKKTFDESKKKFNLSSRMKMIYVQTLSGMSALGYSIPPYCATGPAAPYVDHGVIPNNALSDTLAHELGHILINSGVHSGIDNPADQKNLMFAPGRTGSDIDTSQCKTIYANA